MLDLTGFQEQFEGLRDQFSKPLSALSLGQILSEAEDLWFDVDDVVDASDEAGKTLLRQIKEFIETVRFSLTKGEHVLMSR